MLFAKSAKVLSITVLTTEIPVVAFLDSDDFILVLDITGKLAPTLSQETRGADEPEMMQVNDTSSCSKTAISIGLDSTVGGTREEKLYLK